MVRYDNLDRVTSYEAEALKYDRITQQMFDTQKLSFLPWAITFKLSYDLLNPKFNGVEKTFNSCPNSFWLAEVDAYNNREVLYTLFCNRHLGSV